MEQEKHLIKLADGTELADLDLNGNNYISDTEITEELFEDNLYEVEIDGELHENMKLVAVREDGGRYWFIIADETEAEKKAEKQNAINEYLAMRLGVDLEEVIG